MNPGRLDISSPAFKASFISCSGLHAERPAFDNKSIAYLHWVPNLFATSSLQSPENTFTFLNFSYQTVSMINPQQVIALCFSILLSSAGSPAQGVGCCIHVYEPHNLGARIAFIEFLTLASFLLLSD
ncbi:hypothetical protein Nepgr_001092 [Nepenthes gracilis]|uniref:Uncharacterized protein n=1 Tax=Nepenthes gracilis TaxID=150966 RepID=A0AAD3RXB0_NEPGR|nr:hypothetical protein Nepgr_001092 [Nepenthes gracilis]